MGASPHPELRAVLLDAGDTLICMPRGAEEILQELCRRLGVSISLEQARAAHRQSDQYYHRHYLGYTGDQGTFWTRYHGEALRHLDIEDPTGEKASYLSHQFGLPGIWQACPESAGVCRQLRSMGLKLGVVSNGATTVPDLLAQAELLPFFDVVVTSQALGIEKPDPRIFQVALGRLGVSPREALFVGDLYEVDVLGARAAGLVGVLIDRKGGGGARDCPALRSLEELIPMVESLAIGHRLTAREGVSRADG